MPESKLFRDYVNCVRKRMIVDTIGTTDAAHEIASDVWRVLTTTRSRSIIENMPALREALEMNGWDRISDKELRRHLRESEDRNA